MTWFHGGEDEGGQWEKSSGGERGLFCKGLAGQGSIINATEGQRPTQTYEVPGT